jgi:uncharacterized protein YdiU (UPF0061 family)
MASATGPSFALTYAELPALFHHSVDLQTVSAPHWLLRNEALASSIGIGVDWLRSGDALGALGGNAPLPGATPVAMAYSGHQFGGFVPLLGDGRAMLAGEWLAPDGTRLDLHLKGSGATVYSRNGDGRATLAAMLREYILGEAFAGLGIPASRALAVITTGDPVYRQRKEAGAVLTRVAKSHVRVGTFQLAALHRDRDALQALLDYECARNFPSPPAGLAKPRHVLRTAIARQASLIAQWMGVGFIHGVMNTDNMQVAGETIDFGPCAFMDRFHPQKVFSSIDRNGRYAWDRQPGIALWNLTRLAESLLSLLAGTQDEAIAIAQEELAHFMPAFEQHFEEIMRAKLGWRGADSADGERIATIFRHMMQGGADFTLFFRRLTQVAGGADSTIMSPLFTTPEEAAACLAAWRERAGETPDVAAMRRANPVYIARNHRVEQALAAASAGDLAPTDRLLNVLATPFTEQPGCTDLEAPPAAEEEVRQTFCGT